MRSKQYLNGILTVLALLLAGNFLTALVGDTRPQPAQAAPGGIANAGQQREEIIGQLKLINVRLDALSDTLRNLAAPAPAPGPSPEEVR